MEEMQQSQGLSSFSTTSTTEIEKLQGEEISSTNIFKGIQLLMSQVLHDLISPFSALSAGFDLLSSGSQLSSEATDEIWDLVKQTRQQLYVQLVLFRYVLCHGQGNKEEAKKTLREHATLSNVYLYGEMCEPLKLTVGLSLWLMKQAAGSKKSLSFHANNQLILQADVLRPVSKEYLILQKPCELSCPQESFAYYLYVLAKELGYSIQIERESQSLSVTLKSLKIS